MKNVKYITQFIRDRLVAFSPYVHFFIFKFCFTVRRVCKIRLRIKQNNISINLVSENPLWHALPLKGWIPFLEGG